jgi:hypothetical protein
MPEVKQDSLALPEQGKPSAEIIRSARQTRLAAFTPANLTEAIAMAKMMAASDMVPREYQKKPQNILVAIQFGSEIGLAPMQSLQSVAVINGRPSLWGDAALALVQSHPDFEDIIETTEGNVGVCIVKRRGRSPVRRTFSDDDATKAGLLTRGGPWTQYRARMRQLRARGFALRDSFADVLKGISIAEESMDLAVDTTEAKKTRESLALDVSSLSQSSEPNRGHEDTGLGRSNGKKDEQTQAPAKSDKVMCGDCGKIDGHEPTCKYAGTEQDKKTAQFTKSLYVVKSATLKKTTKKAVPFLMVGVQNVSGQEEELYLWHQTLFDTFRELRFADSPKLVCEVSQKKQGERVFPTIENVIELAGVPYVDNKPAEEGQMPAEDDSDGGLFDEQN